MTVFYRKYRPQKFADLVGQENIVETLLAQLSSGKISHGYLFWGPRGTGKTSTARILAKAVNCTANKKQETKNSKQIYGEPCGKCDSCMSIAEGWAVDLVEIDAASNRGIDEIRDLREKIKLSPFSFKFKVYIIDEAHMLTTEAFNALLKTLEEPPAHAIFILCTTDVAKLPKTIISRLSRFSFRRANDAQIAKALTAIAKEEKIDYEKDAFLNIAKIADGSFRDAVSIFDQLSALGKTIDSKSVLEIGGISTWNQVISLVQIFSEGNLKEAILELERLAEEDFDLSLFTRELISTFEKMLFIKAGLDTNTFANLDEKQISQLVELSENFTFTKLENIMKLLLVAEGEMKLYPMPKISLLLAICKICGEPEEIKEPESQRVKETERVEAGDKDVSKSEDSASMETVDSVSSESFVSLPKSSKSKAVSMSQLEKEWPKFLEKVRKFNIHLGALLKSTRPVSVNGNIVTIEVFWQFHKDKLLEPKIFKALDGFLKEVFGVPLGFQVLLSKKQTRVPKPVDKSDVREVSAGQDLSQIAAEIFSK